MVVSWVGCVYSRMGKSDKEILGERVLVEGILLIRAVGDTEVSR